MVVERYGTSRAFLGPRGGATGRENASTRRGRPTIKKQLQGAPGAAATRSCQLLGGHAWPQLPERQVWIGGLGSVLVVRQRQIK